MRTFVSTVLRPFLGLAALVGARSQRPNEETPPRRHRPLRALMAACVGSLLFASSASFAWKDAQVISINAYNTMTAGSMWSVQVTMLNTGDEDWSPVDQLINPDGRWTAGSDWWMQQSQLVNEYVPPGGTHTFDLWVIVPPDIGWTDMQWQMQNDSQDYSTFGETAWAYLQIIPAPVGTVDNLAATQGTLFHKVGISFTNDTSTSNATQFDLFRALESDNLDDPASWHNIGTLAVPNGYGLGGYAGHFYSFDTNSYVPADIDGNSFTIYDPLPPTGDVSGPWRYFVNVCSVSCSGYVPWDFYDESGNQQRGPTASGYPSSTLDSPPAKPVLRNYNQGTVTGQVVLGWTPDATAQGGYDVYRNGVKLTATPVTGDSYTYAITDITPAAYTVIALNSFGASPPSDPVNDYPNAVPTDASFAMTGSPTVIPDGASWPMFSKEIGIADANLAAGQPESFGVVIVDYSNLPGLVAQVPPFGGKGWQIVWTAQDPITLEPLPDTASLVGTSGEFTYRVFDRSGDYADFTGTITFGEESALATPTNLVATQGTVTGTIRLNWDPVDGATYNVYRNGVQVNSEAIGDPTFDFPSTTATAATFTVRAFDGVTETPDSNSASGYANVAPASTSASLSATANTASSATAPTTVDANLAASQPDTLTYSVLTQPAAGQGTASVVSGKLVWTPPAGFGYTGTTTFNYRATDSTGAYVNGTATVIVAAAGITPGIPGTVAATDGTLTGKVRITWGAGTNAATYNLFSAPSAGGSKTQIASGITGGSYDHTVAGVAPAYYSVQSVSSSAMTSDYSAEDTGFPNANPTTTSAALTATAVAASAPATPSVSDPNGDDTFTFAITVQPTTGQGTASVVNNQLVWTPPAAHNWYGTTTFMFSATDRGGALVQGTATVVVAEAPVPNPPNGVTATQGLHTDMVRLTWTPVSGATGYNVYRAGTKVSATPVTVATFDDPYTTVTAAPYTVRALNANGESADSTPANGYPNKAPTAATATIASAANAASAPATPSVTDPNVQAGQGELFVIAVTGQPSAGTATVVGNRLVWSPPSDNSFAGATSFSFTATDRGGASVSGTATVNVTAWVPPVPTAVVATQGTLTEIVRVTWNAVSGATGYNVYRGGTKINATPVTATTYDEAIASATAGSYTVRAVAPNAESADSVAASGYANVAPTATSATISGDSFTAGSATPEVTDPNKTAGQTESFTYAVVTQPATGQGTASVVSGKLTWTPTNGTVYAGTTTFTYSVTDRAGATAQGTATVNVAQVQLSPIAITFTPIAGLTPPQGGNFRTYTGTTVAGLIRITGPASAGGLTVKVSQNGGEPVTTLSRFNTYATSLRTDNAVMGTPQTVRVQAFQAKATEAVATLDINLDVMVRSAFVLLRAPTLVVNTSDAVIAGSLGMPQRNGSFLYDALQQGSYSVQLHSVGAKNVLTALGDPVTTVGADGSFSLNGGTLPAGRHTLLAVATQTDAPAGTPPKVLKSQRMVIVRDGTPIEVSTINRRPTGASAFLAQVGVWPLDRARLIDMGQITYSQSDDGVAFTPALDDKGVAIAGPLRLFSAQTLNGNIKRFYKAVISNRWTQAQTESEVMEVQSFVVPGIAISGPKATFLGHAVTFNAVSDDQSANLTYNWTLSYGRNDPNPATFTGQQITFDPPKLGQVTVSLSAHEVNAPTENARATKTATLSHVVLPPALSPPVVSGPTVVEIGKSYTWTAFQRSPFPPNSGTDLAIESHWVLPDGTVSTANPVTYTMKETDSDVVRYASWVDGYPGSNVHTDLKLRAWGYVFPAMKAMASATTGYATLKVTYSAGATTAAGTAGMRGEPLTFTWTVPQGGTLLSQKDGTAVVEYATAGAYLVKVAITDTRGNRADVDAPVVNVAPPKALAFTFTLTSSDKWNRPPGPVVARAAPTSIPTSDAVAGTTFFVNGQQVGSEVAGGVASINLPDPGTYEVTARMRSTKGATAEATQSITLTTGDKPTCVLKKNGNGTTTLWFTTTCSVQRGVIQKYKWKVNGTDSAVTATSLSFPAAQIGIVNDVQVIAVTDRGQEGGATFSIATGVSTPTP